METDELAQYSQYSDGYEVGVQDLIPDRAGNFFLGHHLHTHSAAQLICSSLFFCGSSD
jgi:hypothetical protein